METSTPKTVSPAQSATVVPRHSGGDIAVVGMACMFPKAPGLRQFWENILRRLDCIQEIPEQRWQIPNFFDEDRFARDKVYSKWGGFLESIRFDPMKWKIPPSSLLSIDPIQLLSLEVAAQAFEDAGYDKREFPRERTGVLFACAGSHDVGSDYAFRTMLQHYLPRVKDLTPEVRQHITDELNATLPEWTEDSFPGFLMNVIAGRIANRFDLGGPNYVVDAACAASLAALHAAIAQLRLGTVDAMLVGAADGTNNPFCYMSFAKTHALSPRGRSRPFDNSADGIALGEGIAAIMIRRLEDAERDGDKIYAVIKGIGASSDGRNRSMTAPHPPGQILAMKRAYEDAGVPAATVSLVEAHGTGTAVGDSTEITSLHTLFSEATKDEQYAAVGSVKSMIGHTKTCAGLASLVKTTLALKHKVLPPTINVETPNENVDFRHSPFFINSETRPWFDELGQHPRRAGVSAFGFGGTNFHVVMEEYVGKGRSQFDLDMSPRTAELCLWQRASRSELVAALQELQTRLKDSTATDLAQLACSLRQDEQQLATTSNVCRLAIIAATVEDLKTKLRKAIDQLASKDGPQDPTGIYFSDAAPVSTKQVAFLYPGQGSQSVNMLRDLVVANRWAHDLFSTANQTLGEFFPVALSRMVYPPPAFSAEEDEERKQRLNQTQVAQPALGLVEVFATKLLERYGVTPGGVAGHSYGEYVALYAAGSLTLEDLLSVSGHRGKVSAAASQTCPGAMAAVQAGGAQTQKALDDLKLPAYLANLNAPDQTIIAGPEEVVVQAVAQFNAQGIRSKRIPVTAAFHTPALATAAQPLSVVLKQTPVHAPQLPVYSNTLAEAYPTQEGEIRKLLQRHIVEPVRFEEEMRRMRADGYSVFVEVGPGRVLSGLLGRIFVDNAVKVLSLDASGRDGVTQFAHLLGQLFALGLPVNAAPWFADRGLKFIGTTEYLTQVAQTAQPKKTDWILSVHGAKPVTPLPARKGNPGDGLRAKFGGKGGTTEPTSTPASAPAATVVNAPSPIVDSNVAITTVGLRNEPAAIPATGTRAALATTTSARRQVTAEPAPAPAPLPPAGRFVVRGAAASATQHGSSLNGHANGTANNGHHPEGDVSGRNGHAVKNGHQATSVSGTKENQPVAAASATAAPTTSGTSGTGSPGPTLTNPVLLPGSSVPMAPCLPVFSQGTFASPIPNPYTSVSPTQMRSAVSTSPNPNAETGAMNPAAAQLILQSQALMMQMLDLQKWQQQVALRFVDAHAQLVNSCGTATPMAFAAPMIATSLPLPTATPVVEFAPAVSPTPVAAPAPVAPAPVAAAPVAVAAPLPVAAPQPVAAAVKPAPVALATPKAMPTASATPTRPAVTVNRVASPAPVAAAPIAAPVAKPAPIAAPAAPVAQVAPATSSDGDAIPTPEEFKTDLLDAVSERTGYPIEMLDLELPMEAGLGIDSIKTVEIFSNLKKYHAYFQQDDQDEEEALKEFTKLKTLGDIISAYELRYQAVTSNGAAPKPSSASGEAVERYSLEAAEATAGGQKKTTLVNS